MQEPWRGTFHNEAGHWAREAATVQASVHRGLLTTRNVLNAVGPAPPHATRRTRDPTTPHPG
jgi:hypothetical protein